MYVFDMIKQAFTEVHIEPCLLLRKRNGLKIPNYLEITHNTWKSSNTAKNGTLLI